LAVFAEATIRTSPRPRPRRYQVDRPPPAEEGVAAHWRYKEGGHPPRKEDVKVFTWLRSILEYGREVTDSAEYMETAMGELLGGEVYVFTPAGAVLS